MLACSIGYVNDTKNIILQKKGSKIYEICNIGLRDSSIIYYIEFVKDKLLFCTKNTNFPFSGKLYQYDINKKMLNLIGFCEPDYKPFTSYKNKIVIAKGTENGDKILLLNDGLTKEIINMSSRWPVFSPNGERLLFYNDANQLYLYYFKENKYVQLIDCGGRNNLRIPIYDVSWLSNDEIIMADDEGLKIININDKKTILLEENTIDDEIIRHIYYNNKSKILLIGRDIFDGSNNTLVYKYDIKTKKKDIIINNNAINIDIVWLSKKEFIFSSNSEGNFNIYRYNLKKKVLTKITNGPDNYRNPFVIE